MRCGRSSVGVAGQQRFDVITGSCFRMYYGPEYLSAAITERARQYGIKLDYIQPGKPQQHAYVERFNRTVRYEWLSQYHWEDLDHWTLESPV